jgi:hypothetical protein
MIDFYGCVPHPNAHPRLQRRGRTLSALLLTVGLAAALCAPAGAAEPINCRIQQGACTQSLAGGRVTLDINPRPVKAMIDLTFRVTLEALNPGASPYIDLGMPAMEMGPNRVALKKVARNTWEGTGIIVRCPSGKRLWRASVTIPEVGVAEFIFDVVY